MQKKSAIELFNESANSTLDPLNIFNEMNEISRVHDLNKSGITSAQLMALKEFTKKLQGLGAGHLTQMKFEDLSKLGGYAIAIEGTNTIISFELAQVGLDVDLHSGDGYISWEKALPGVLLVNIPITRLDAI